MELVVAQPRSFPVTRKSKMMRAVEAAHGNRDIRDIILDELPKHRRDIDTAHALGIFHATLSAWIARLSIIEEADAARDGRRTADNHADRV